MGKMMRIFIAATLALTLGIPVAALADEGVVLEPVPLNAAEQDTDYVGVDPADQSAQAADCTLTVRYIEYVYADGSNDIIGTSVLGEWLVQGLKPGDVVNSWDYVVDIPGHFFFDGSAPEIVISENNAENVLELMYGKLYNSEFTVNYYLMEGADLTTGSWAGTLESNPRFIKMGEQTFMDQRFDDLVEGDDYEYDIGGLYAVDTYPESIRLSANPDDNVINVLYVPALTNLPDEIVVPDNPQSPDADQPPSAGGDQNGSGGTDPTPPEVIIPITPGDTGIGSGSFAVPSDEGQLQGASAQGNDAWRGSSGERVAITDEMMANPVSQETAERYIQAFEMGKPVITPLPIAQPESFPYLGIALALYLIAFVAICIWAYERERADEKR